MTCWKIYQKICFAIEDTIVPLNPNWHKNESIVVVAIFKMAILTGPFWTKLGIQINNRGGGEKGKNTRKLGILNWD